MPSTNAGSATLTPAEMADECDVSIDTLRYYEREGLLDPVERTAGNQRRYSPGDIAWVQVLRCLRVTEMPIRDLRRFADLVRQGDDGIADRLALLEAHRAEVLRRMDELRVALDTIDHKIEVYRDATSR